MFRWAHFSQETIQQLRAFHVLNGQQVRSYAEHFIRKGKRENGAVERGCELETIHANAPVRDSVSAWWISMSPDLACAMAEATVTMQRKWEWYVLAIAYARSRSHGS